MLLVIRILEKELNIKTSSIYYHFPTKQMLVLELIKRYLKEYTLRLPNIKSPK
ncbi:hypothetical protein ABSA28_00531 [Candidatus Hepatincolaceae symbiont of Richtersius coronifer]